MRILVLIGLLFCTQYVQAGEYNVNTIPDSLLKNANAVIREHSLHIRIVSKEEVYSREKIAITIFNEHGSELSVCRQLYGLEMKITGIEGVLYDAQGNQLRTSKKKEVLDKAVFDFVTFSDLRYKEHSFHHAAYPYTIVYEVEKKYNSLFFLPDMRLVPGYKVSMQQALLAIECPADIRIRTKAFHTTAETIPTNAEAVNMQKFSFHNIPAFEKDNFAAPSYYPLPIVVIAPGAFSFDNYEGDFSDWKKFGAFFYALNKSRDVLPADMKLKVHAMVDTCLTDIQKIQVLYKYLQAQTRYVSIQLGIGGFQTFDAISVATNGYGDCKALSNYMKAMLKEAGITSYEVLVQSGRDVPPTLPKGFSHDLFDHVILAVPQRNDTVWLECTADDLPAGFLSNFTDDRDVLMVTPEGGIVVHTPVYGINENKLQMQTMIRTNGLGEFTGNTKMVYSGCLSDKENSHIDEKSKEETETYLNKKLGLPSYKVTNFNIDKSNNGVLPQLVEHIDIEGMVNITQTGKRIYITPSVATLGLDLNPGNDERTAPFFIRNSFQVTDTSTIVFDNAYTPEQLPASVSHSFPFGAYSSSVSFEAPGTIRVIRMYRQQKGSYAPALFKDYTTLAKAAGSDLSRQKVVLLKKD